MGQPHLFIARDGHFKPHDASDDEVIELTSQDLRLPHLFLTNDDEVMLNVSDVSRHIRDKL